MDENSQLNAAISTIKIEINHVTGDFTILVDPYLGSSVTVARDLSKLMAALHMGELVPHFDESLRGHRGQGLVVEHVRKTLREISNQFTSPVVPARNGFRSNA